MPNLWSEYKSPEDYEADAGETVLLNQTMLPQLIEFYTQHVVTQGIKAIELGQLKTMT